MATTEQIKEIVNAGWVFGNLDEFPGDRIYPSYGEAKRPVGGYVRIVEGEFILHNEWKDEVVMTFGGFTEMLAHVEQYGRVVPAGFNVWD